MQVGTQLAEGSELHAWRRFLAGATRWLSVLLLGSAAICWVAANWPALDKTTRFAGAQALLAVCALAAAWVGLRLRTTPDTRRRTAGAVLALAGLVLGALLALLGQTYQTGADTWELFAIWALLLLPWALAAGSQAVWLLWVLVLNMAALLWLGEHLFSWWVALSGPGFPSLVLAALNLLLLAGWEWAAHHWQAGTRVGPRVLASLAVGVLVLALMVGDYIIQGLGTYTGLAWAAVTAGLGLYYQRIRRDLVILAMLAGGVICVSLRVAGEWLLRLEPGVWVTLPLAGLLMAEAVWAARWLRRLGARPVMRPADAAIAGEGSADAEPAGPSAGLPVEATAAPAVPPMEVAGGLPPAPVVPATPAADTVTATATDTGTVGAESPPASLPADKLPGSPVIALSDAPAGRPETPWYVHALLGMSAWLATLLLLLFLALSGLIASREGALVTGLALCTIAVVVLRGQATPFWRQCARAIGFAGQILIAFGLYDATSLTGACLFVLGVGAAVYALAPDTLLRFLSGWMMALASAGLVWRGLAPGLENDRDMLDLLLREDALRATFIWLPVTVAGAWLAAVSFWLSHWRLPPSRVGRLDPLGWAYAMAVQASVWLAGGVSAPQWPSLWHLHPATAVLTAAGALLPALVGAAMLWPRRGRLPATLVYGLPLALLVLAVFWLPSPGIAFALTWMLLGFGLRKPRLTIFGILGLLSYLLLYYYQLEVPLLHKGAWLAGAGALMLLLYGLARCLPRPDRAPAPAREPVTRHQRWRMAAVLGGLVLILVVANGGIWQRERLLASGRVAILELAPVDPRSLMQGDYMALSFEAGRDVQRLSQDDATQGGEGPGLFARTEGYVVLAPDAQGVARAVRIQDMPQPRSGNEIVLRYRVRPDGVRIVTNAYFFPEGQAEHYAAARYGEIRVDDRGTGLLVRMLDAQLEPL